MLPTDLPKTSGIYKIFFLDPNLIYIGSSVNLRNRYRQHVQGLRKSKHGNSHLQHAFDKYGEDALQFDVIEIVERKEDLIEREQHYLDTLKPYYNIHPNARSSLGVKRSPETRKKNGLVHKGQPSPMKGKKHSPESLAKMSASLKGLPAWNKGKPWPEEHQQRLRTMKKGKPNPHPGFRGPHKFTPETLAIRNTKISARKLAMTPEQNALREERRKSTLAKNPEIQARRIEKWHATMAAKTPEQREQEIEKWRASKYAQETTGQIIKQPSLWDDTSAS